MNHRVRDFNTSGELIEDDAAGLLLEDLDEFAVGGEVLFVAKDSGSEMAREGTGGAQVVIRIPAADD